MTSHLQSFQAEFQKIELEVSKAIIGQKDIIRNVLAAAILGGNVLLEGMPGLGKTQLVKTLGKVLSLDFSRIQFTPDLMPADITGTEVYSHENKNFSFRKGPVFSNIVLADEINRATPKTQSALLEAMQERTVSIGGATHTLPSPFFVLATQNPIELEGTYPLPEAQLDRFLIKLQIQSPSREELLSIVELTSVDGLNENTPKVVCDSEGLTSLGAAVTQVAIAKPVAEYAMDIIVATHHDSVASPATAKYIRHGASPRGAQALIGMSRIYALLDGRFNVAFEDVRAAAFPVLRHRLILSFEAMTERIHPDDIIAELVSINTNH